MKGSWPTKTMEMEGAKQPQPIDCGSVYSLTSPYPESKSKPVSCFTKMQKKDYSCGIPFLQSVASYIANFLPNTGFETAPNRCYRSAVVIPCSELSYKVFQPRAMSSYFCSSDSSTIISTWPPTHFTTGTLAQQQSRQTVGGKLH